MPSAFAASITVAPLWTSVSIPSTVTFGMASGRPTLRRAGRGGITAGLAHRAALVIDVVLELVAEMQDEALHRERGRVPERADGAPGNVVSDAREQVQILVAAFAVLD